MSWATYKASNLTFGDRIASRAGRKTAFAKNWTTGAAFLAAAVAKSPCAKSEMCAHTLATGYCLPSPSNCAANSSDHSTKAYSRFAVSSVGALSMNSRMKLVAI
eukprot:Protomagalhaensia_wolfi_Nauph_80__470@NODE_1263_length_1624_cov_86_062461_g972_i0_p4_GENE_NODE_1263_length_1624_cov_86_062461_g972_i0NODE_1263_length_1624_cov_86_062461_g972_i0_p4_ORF_typecomplete_len104_score0_61UCR_TM/PF02921_14/23UCR_TM/PF02921_14/9_6_NODE_1263_length_1624_cov_86_062461_g972_i012191530